MSEDWLLAGASVTGSSHERSGKPCEDAFCIVRDDEGFALLAADGASSRKYGGAGARALAPAMGRFILANAPDVMSRKIRPDVVMDVALSVLNDVAGKNGGVLDDYATTLVALLVHGGEAMTCHVGDGAIFCLEGEFPRCISHPERDPGGGPYTTFVTSKGARPRMFHYAVPVHWTGFLCITDGAEPTLYNSVKRETSGLVTQLLSQFDLDDSRADREGALKHTCRTQLQPRSEDDITLVGARRARVAGVWGCPACHRRLAKVRMNASQSALFGYCRECGRTVFHHTVSGMDRPLSA